MSIVELYGLLFVSLCVSFDSRIDWVFSSKYVFIALFERSTIFDIALIGRYIFFIIISNNALFWNNITTKTPGPSRLLLYGQHLKNIATCYFLSIKCGRKTNQWFVHKVFFSQTGVRKIILIKCHTALVVKKTFPMNIQPQILLKV